MERIWLKHYEAGVPATLSYPKVPVYHFLEENARQFPHHAAVLVAAKNFSSVLTYRQIEHLANRFANGLIWLGIKPGDRVAVQLPNLPQFIVGFYGALKAGAVIVPTNPLYKAHDLSTVLKDSGARAILTLPRFMPALGEVVAGTGLESIIVTEPYDFFPFPWKQLAWWRFRKELRPAGGLRLPALLRSASPRPPGVKVAPDDLAVLQYTGGTTGVPKGAMLTHRNLVANFTQMRSWLTDLKEGEERFLSVAPFFHVYGLTVGLNVAISIASTVICVMMGLFDTRLVAQQIARHRPTIFPGVPAMYLAINQLKEVQQYNLNSIRVCVSGSAPLPLEVQTQFERLTGAKVVEGYGLSEASPGTHVNPIYGQRKVGSIGLPLPDTEARIVDTETGERELPVGEAGELVIRGPQVMKGYWSAPEETAATLRGGWLHTGDIARMDDDGYFFIVDRKKDLVIVGGLKVYPREIEEMLHGHPKVKEAAVAGVSHRVRGELLVAQVVLKDGVADDPRAIRRELVEFLKERLAPYKVPRRIEIASALPKTAVGKVLRREIREAVAARADDDA
ncbi:MAG: long-chain fatty acid--CoA ligase [Bacillati bacterium ANGP1]|uniref:Long-chain fatty acid--CoA ligase n=1 Tax=Candidatus Segetimicrobium genomatis TaxID=2569760 RepID=A0A537JL23_9BACT|nr:MAG: long-chain fatty acid--CoA ligase [Terrabacteria group bacterium ANGP1]